MRRKLANKRAKASQKRPHKQDGPIQPSAPAGPGSEQFLRVHSKRILVLLCAYAGLRIWIFAAAFPIFNNIDEQSHLAAIEMYGHGQWPGRELPRLDQRLARFFALYGSPEYLIPADRLTAYGWVPFYQLPGEVSATRTYRTYLHFLNQPNYEAQSTPLYYLLGGA